MTAREPFMKKECGGVRIGEGVWINLGENGTPYNLGRVVHEANAAFNKRLDEEIAKVERLRFVLKELHALVWGEAPSLLCEDSGGDALLDCKILEVLEP